MKRLHRAWAVCLGCTFMLLICGGLGINAFSVSQPYILAQNGFTNTQTSMIVTVRSITHLLSMFAVTLYYQKAGYRLGMTLATALLGISFALFAVASSLWSYYLAAAVAGMASGLGCMVPATVLMMRWFSSHRAAAVGVCSAGTGLATVAFAPVLTALTTRYSLRVCFFFETAVCLAAAVAVFFLVRSSPESCGERPYGTAKPESAQERALHNIHPSRLRWALLCLAVILLGAASPGFSHMMILFTTAGFSGAQAARSVSILGLTLMAGKFSYGFICDRFGTQRTNWLFGALLLIGCLLCALANLHIPALMYLAAVFFGLGVTLNTVGTSIWATDFSTPELMSRNVQLFQLCYAIGSLAFSFMPGAFADLTGSYTPAYIVLFFFSVYALAVVQSTYRLGSKTGAGV